MTSWQELRNKPNGIDVDETAHNLISVPEYDTIALSIKYQQATFEDLRKFFHTRTNIEPTVIATDGHFCEGYRKNKHTADEVIFQLADRTGIKLTRYKNQGQTIIQFFGLYQYTKSGEPVSRLSSFKDLQAALTNRFGSQELHRIDVCFDAFKQYPAINLEILQELFGSNIGIFEHSISITTARTKTVIYDKSFKNDINLPITRFEQSINYQVQGHKSIINDWLDIETVGDYYRYDFIRDLQRLEAALFVPAKGVSKKPYSIFEDVQQSYCRRKYIISL